MSVALFVNESLTHVMDSLILGLVMHVDLLELVLRMGIYLHNKGE